MWTSRLLFAAARSKDPEELRSAGDFVDGLMALMFPDPDAPQYPFLRLDMDYEWFQFRPGQLTVWTGYNGHGKSLILSQVQLGLMAQGERFCVFSGEMQPEYLLQRMALQATGTAKPSREYVRAVADYLAPRFWIFAQNGSAKLDRLLEVFRYANRRYGVRHMVVDSLMMTDVPEDGAGAFTAQKDAVQKLCNFAKQFGCHRCRPSH